MVLDFTSEFCFHKLSLEQIDRFWLIFADALILTRARFELLHSYSPPPRIVQ